MFCLCFNGTFPITINARVELALSPLLGLTSFGVELDWTVEPDGVHFVVLVDNKQITIAKRKR
jgi:hypothetical protein